MAKSPNNSNFSPPPSPSHPKSNLPMLYYGLVIIGTAAIVLALYNLLIIRWCAESGGRRRRTLRIGENNLVGLRRNNYLNLGVSSFRYKKKSSSADDDDSNNEYELECVVCLSVFEEGEEVRKLPKCKHCFHAPCIDMWLYSHLDCPLCRSPVEPPAAAGRLKNTAAESAVESLEGNNTSREGLLVLPPGNTSMV